MRTRKRWGMMLMRLATVTNDVRCSRRYQWTGGGGRF